MHIYYVTLFTCCKSSMGWPGRIFFALLRFGFCTPSLFSPCIFASRDLLLLDESNRNGKLWLAEGIHHLLRVQLVAAPCHPVNSQAEKQGLRLCQQTQLWMLCWYYPSWLKSINLSSKIFSRQSLQNSELHLRATDIETSALIWKSKLASQPHRWAWKVLLLCFVFFIHVSSSVCRYRWSFTRRRRVMCRVQLVLAARCALKLRDVVAGRQTCTHVPSLKEFSKSSICDNSRGWTSISQSHCFF